MNPVVVALLGAGSIAAWPAPSSLLATRAAERRLVLPRVSSSDVDAEALQVLDAAGAVLAAGTPSNRAVRTALEPVLTQDTRSGEGWSQLDNVLRDDGDVSEAWLDLSQQWSTRSLADVAAAWRISQRLGSPLSDALEAAAAGLRARRENSAAVDAATAGAQATMAVLTLLPLVGIGLGMMLGVDVVETYAGLSGLVTLWPGLLMLWLGRRWAARMVRRALEPPSRSEPAETRGIGS